MALTFVKVKIFNPANPKKSAVVKFLVDSGAVYSVVPQEILRKIGIRPHSKETFSLANGEFVERAMGDALFHYQGKRRASPVIFGQKDDSALLGGVSLEALGLMLDPLRREIRSLPMVLGGMPQPKPSKPGR